MRHIATRLAIAALALGAAATAANAQGAGSPGNDVRTVEDLGKGRAVLDGHRSPRPWSNQTLGHLIERWGEPARTRRTAGGVACIAVWRSPRVVAHLANLGYIPEGESACSPEYGSIQALETAGRDWATRRGVRVGASLRKLRAAYPGALAQPRSGRKIWLLRPYKTGCIGDCGPGVHRTSGVVAEIRAGRVKSFTVRIGAAGD